MKIDTQDYNDVTVIGLQGDFDVDFVEQFEGAISRIISRGRKGVVLDMGSVVFIDSAGLERLLWARDYCNDNACQLRLAGLDENCSKILELTRLRDEFERHAELASAVKSFA